MKKAILSSIIVILFGLYSFIARSGGLSTQLNKLNPVPVEPAGTTTSNTGQITKNSDCVYIPYQDNENTENSNDGETGEVKTTNGYYKCTTITVDTRTINPNTTTPPTTTPQIASVPKNPTPVKTPTPVSVTPPPPVVKPKSNAIWNDGTFIGDSTDAYYGNVQVSVTIAGGRMTDIAFLDYPQDRRTSLQKSNEAMPILKSEAISSQSANVNTVSGVTYTSEAFISSLSSALAQAKI